MKKYTTNVLISWLFVLPLMLPFLLNAQISFLEKDFYNQVALGDRLLHPVGIAFDHMGTGYIWLKRGVVVVLDTTGQLLERPLIDISEEVVGNNDHGLLGFALDPEFRQNGYFYLFYTVDRHHLFHFGKESYDPEKTIINEATIGRITRYQADVAKGFRQVVPGSRKMLVGEDIADRSFPVLMGSHGMGTLAFGKDGTLLASCGDASAFQRWDIGSDKDTYFVQALGDGIILEKENVGSYKAQLIDNLAGKIIRIDPETGDGLSSNPFYDSSDPRAPSSRVWALGFRNPYRFVFTPTSGSHDPLEGNPGHMIVGDVGVGSWEEISTVEKGGENFGWPFYEGLEYRWQFWGNSTLNLDVPNPLYRQGGCGQAFLSFENLFKEVNKVGVYQFLNPCNQLKEIPASINTFVHKRPIIAWSNAAWNPPARALLPAFEADGKASELRIEESAQIEAIDFDGYSVIPGFFYQNGNFPEKYEGALFVADFSGWIKVFYFDKNDQLTKIEGFLNREKGIVGLTQNPRDGCLYYVQFNTHSINKICFGGNPPPNAIIAVSKNYGASPLTVQFDASQSFDPFGEMLTYFWDFGNGNTSSQTQPTVTFEASSDEPTIQKIKLKVTDEIGKMDSTTQIISLNNTPPQVTITSFENGDQYPVSGASLLQLSAQVIDAEHKEQDLDYTWQVFLHHNLHFHPEPEQKERESSTIIAPLGCESGTYWYRIRLTVRDLAGLESFDEKEIFPYCGPPIVTDFALKGKANDEGINLDWSFTQNVDNIEKLELYRGSSYNELQIIQPVFALDNFNYFDAAPINGDNYYQLKVLNEEGLYDFSNLIKIQFPLDPLIRIFPNPVLGTSFRLGLREAFNEQINLKVFNAIGQQVIDYQLDAVKGEAFLRTVLIPQMTRGIYLYQVENGEQIYTGKLAIEQ